MLLMPQEKAVLLRTMGIPKEEILDENSVEDIFRITRDRRGRPLTITALMLFKLEQAFKVGCTIDEACIWAGIGRSTLYRYMDNFPDFKQWIDEMREHPVIVARMTVVKSVGSDPTMALAYLKAKRKHEFAEKTIIGGERAMTTEELEGIARGDVHIQDDIEEDETEQARPPAPAPILLLPAPKEEPKPETINADDKNSASK